jgi:hypothetical protein
MLLPAELVANDASDGVSKHISACSRYQSRRRWHCASAAIRISSEGSHTAATRASAVARIIQSLTRVKLRHRTSSSLFLPPAAKKHGSSGQRVLIRGASLPAGERHLHPALRAEAETPRHSSIPTLQAIRLRQRKGKLLTADNTQTAAVSADPPQPRAAAAMGAAAYRA